MLLRLLKNLATPALLLIVLFSFLIVTDPQELPAWLLIVPFLLLFLALFTALRLLLQAFQTPPLARRSWAVPAVAAAIPTLLLILSSASQLTLRDGLLSLFFGLGLVWYLRRISFVNR